MEKMTTMERTIGSAATTIPALAIINPPASAHRITKSILPRSLLNSLSNFLTITATTLGLKQK